MPVEQYKRPRIQPPQDPLVIEYKPALKRAMHERASIAAELHYARDRHVSGLQNRSLRSRATSHGDHSVRPISPDRPPFEEFLESIGHAGLRTYGDRARYFARSEYDVVQPARRLPAGLSDEAAMPGPYGEVLHVRSTPDLRREMPRGFYVPKEERAPKAARVLDIYGNSTKRSRKQTLVDRVAAMFRIKSKRSVDKGADKGKASKRVGKVKQGNEKVQPGKRKRRISYESEAYA